MPGNPYKFFGPLDPVGDNLVCMPRSKEKAKVIRGIIDGDYWTILGPRQIGKTTFLRQLMHELSVHYCVYFNFEVSPGVDEKFYQWVIDRIIDTVPASPDAEITKKWETFGPELNFFHFLEEFQPEKKKKIIFFFDEMEKAHCARSFLNLWRKVFHERYHRDKLKKYAVVIAGKEDLGSLANGETSPFNIARKLELGNLSPVDAGELITGPCREYDIQLEPGAIEKLLTQASGHPQLLQHLCYMLTEQALEREGKKQPGIDEEDVEHAIKKLLIENDNLKALELEIKANKELEELCREILDGEDRDYMTYRRLSIAGTGPVVQKGGFCAIRSRIYEKMLKKLLGMADEDDLYILLPSEKIAGEEYGEYAVTVYVPGTPDESRAGEEEMRFLKSLFDISAVRLEIEKDCQKLPEVALNRTEKLIFCYLSYQSYKSSRNGGSPGIRQYHLSSVPRNNLKQEPEWSLFVETVNQAGNLSKNSTSPDPTIRQAIFSTRKKLRHIGAADLLPRQKPGSGEGYWLNGSVTFALPDRE
jgi:hypothetical protein